MNRKVVVVLVLMVALIIVGCAKKEPFPPIEVQPIGRPKAITRPVTEAFKDGEKITLAVKWMGIVPIGKASIEVKEWFYQGREAYYLTVEMKSSPFFSFFYKVNDVFESYLDARILHTLRFEEHLREGRHFMEKVTIYDQKNHLAEFTNKLTKKVKKVKIPPHVQDPISSLYYLRAQEFEEGKTFSFNVHNHKENYQVEMKVLRKEKIKIPSGEYLAWALEPAITCKREPLPKESFIIWLSADNRKIPLLIKARTEFGRASIYLEASEFE
ncbi:DUF3108 domain-containing protein [bacterium]|nr:DUF3108 domain-containing protein [bacterium]